jgi:thiol-disulfide isomerase/thioredoxin
MAAVIVQTVTQQTTSGTVFTLLSFSFGAGAPMLLLVLMGRQILTGVSFFKSYTHVIRKILGTIILVSVIFSTWLNRDLSVSPANADGPAPIERGLVQGLSTPYTAPPIEGIESWINSPLLKLEQLKGKVVLVDFWTYSCINCVRTLPTLTKWDETYRDKGLVIIGIHTPEFEFEKKLKNVQSAVRKHNIHYAVALDNTFKTWLNFQNRYWPAHYLINRQGQVVYTHFGEGNAEITESNIRYLLGLTAPVEKSAEEKSENSFLTPETYLGFDRAERFAKPSTLFPNRPFQYPALDNIPANEWSLEGKWLVEKQHATATEAGAKIKIHFKAKKVFLVLGNSENMPITARITLNGDAIRDEAGEDVFQSSVTVTKATLYELASLPSHGEGLLEVQATSPGLQAYAFTFGG